MADDKYAFLVRGAKLRCEMGSHARKLNLPSRNTDILPMMKCWYWLPPFSQCLFNLPGDANTPASGSRRVLDSAGRKRGGTTCAKRTLRMRGRADGLQCERIGSWNASSVQSDPILTAKHEMDKVTAGCRDLNLNLYCRSS